MSTSAIAYGSVCPWPQKLRHLQPRKKHQNRIRVRVRSFVDGHVLRTCSEAEARFMCAENPDGSEMLGQDGNPLEAVAYRLTRLKAPFTDIKLMEPERNKRTSPGTLTMNDMQNNAFGKAFRALGPTDSIRALERSIGTVDSWPEIHDTRNVVISAGKAHGVTEIAIENRYLNFA